MHEERLFRDLREHLSSIAATTGPARVLRVRIWLGALCHVQEAGLREAWPSRVHDTAMAGASLEVERSLDLGDPRAQDLVLSSLVVEDPPRATLAGRTTAEEGGFPCA